MSVPWQLVVPGSLWGDLLAHLFPGDGEEHGAVIAAGVARSERGTRLLARELFPARDGVDFVASPTAHRRLTPAFVNERIRHCRDAGLAYLAVHNHGGADEVGFSGTDQRSHERGYPALLDIARGQPVGALVLARGALAGDIWTPDGARRAIKETIVLERNRVLVHPRRSTRQPLHAAIDDRQARIYGDAGQHLLRGLEIGVIGAGGIGLPIVAALARLGVGRIVTIDPDRVEPSNLPRLPESTRWDAMTLLTAPGRPASLRRLGARLASPKVHLARRVARRARRAVAVEAIRGNVADADVAAHLRGCDYLFLAADSHVARAVFNALVHQYLIPGVQIGSKVDVGADGTIGAIFSVVRPVTPDDGCLWCNGLVNPARLAEEALPEAVREAQRYLPRDDAPAPSVITLNALGVAQATNHFMLAMTGMLRPSPTAGDYRRFEARAERLLTEIPRRDPACPECGLGSASVRARGDGAPLPVRERCPRGRRAD